MTEAWVERLRAAARMGITPEGFWRLSLAEWQALVRSQAPAAMGREDLSALMRAHPDEGQDDGQL